MPMHARFSSFFSVRKRHRKQHIGDHSGDQVGHRQIHDCKEIQCNDGIENCPAVSSKWPPLHDDGSENIYDFIGSPTSDARDNRSEEEGLSEPRYVTPKGP